MVLDGLSVLFFFFLGPLPGPMRAICWVGRTVSACLSLFSNILCISACIFRIPDDTMIWRTGAQASRYIWAPKAYCIHDSFHWQQYTYDTGPVWSWRSWLYPCLNLIVPLELPVGVVNAVTFTIIDSFCYQVVREKPSPFHLAYGIWEASAAEARWVDYHHRCVCTSEMSLFEDLKDLPSGWRFWAKDLLLHSASSWSVATWVSSSHSLRRVLDQSVRLRWNYLEQVFLPFFLRDLDVYQRPLPEATGESIW